LSAAAAWYAYQRKKAGTTPALLDYDRPPQDISSSIR
jgi:hypothetical protein